MKIKSDLGSKIKAYRVNKNMTQDELAELMEVKRQTISSWEVGRTEPNFQQAMKLCAIFECSVEDLVSNYASTIHTISLYTFLNDENRALVDGFVQMLYDKQGKPTRR